MAIANTIMTNDNDDPPAEEKHHDIALDAATEKADKASSSGSGSLTQRAALIRDELLGNDSLEHDSVHESLPSSGSSADRLDNADEKVESQSEDDSLEERLSSSAIALSLRHIAMAFDEKSRELESLRKIHQTHEEETALLRAQIEDVKEERETMTWELNELKSSHASTSCELEALKIDVENKDELLCLSDSICSRIFDMIHAIKAQIEAAESLSSAIRTISSPSSSSTASHESNAVSLTSSDVSSTPTAFASSPTSIQALIKQIEAKYSE
ncbi:hypothetical protein EX895_006531 [Sporisorium graminicola]|uniref:Uncharacterized protein n=1 Tax=Sporisorium graminicola TaxID=280036 RepID=A0A4V6ET06_9BASI|nr:hypothetical protein EX895_006531 [Sporisorium graminicola]TKY84629.1 hypothetical protein EX895_006531 [Sporisorium graminicola]